MGVSQEMFVVSLEYGNLGKIVHCWSSNVINLYVGNFLLLYTHMFYYLFKYTAQTRNFLYKSVPTPVRIPSNVLGYNVSHFTLVHIPVEPIRFRGIS